MSTPGACRGLAEVPEGRVRVLTDKENEEIGDIFKEKKCRNALDVKSITTIRAYNEMKHHTEEFERDDCTILRRGQQFFVQISFDRNINEKDLGRIQLAYGAIPNEPKGTLIRIPLDLKDDGKVLYDLVGGTWKAETRFYSQSNVVAVVTSPPDAIIGEYRVFVETKQKDDKEFTRKEAEKNIIMLFNPWCEEDVVYMEKEEEREEYVMNEDGLIWIGSKHLNYPIPWDYDQFQEPVLKAALTLLDEAGIKDEGKNSPTIITRAISAMVNSNIDQGVLTGRWKEPYAEGCTNPSEWIGSLKIIEQYMQTQKPVRYGQCWVFAGVTTTLLRALGIPTRPVTNFESAHDKDESMTIDKYFDENDEFIPYMSDSIWNFHVWNESWFKRCDLPDPKYNGWQAIDGIPQELSGGTMQCGPASVLAVKQGDVNLPYDSGFIFAEVQADEMIWQKNTDENGPSYYLSFWKYGSVGGDISTKAVGKNCKEVLDNNYRFIQGSDEDTKVKVSMSRFSSNRIKNLYSSYEPEKEIEVEILIPTNANFGEDFTVKAKVKNTTKEDRKVSLAATVLHCYYTGVPGKRLKAEHLTDTVKGGKEAIEEVKVSFNEYKDTDGSFDLYVSVTNQTTGRKTITEEKFTLQKPKIVFKVPDQIKYNEETKAVVQIKNTTPITMTKCKFRIESTGSLEEVIRNKSEPLAAGKEWSETVVLKPVKSSKVKGRITASFSSFELTGMKGASEELKITK